MVAGQPAHCHNGTKWMLGEVFRLMRAWRSGNPERHAPNHSFAALKVGRMPSIRSPAAHLHPSSSGQGRGAPGGARRLRVTPASSGWPYRSLDLTLAIRRFP
jgi:hypothetical protein